MRQGAITLAVTIATMLSGHSGVSLANENENEVETPAPFFNNASLEIWIYGAYQKHVSHSLLNPGNRIAELPSWRAATEARLDLRKDFGAFDVLLAPHLIEEAYTIQDDDNLAAEGRLRLAQGFVRRKSGSHTFVLGRERLTWGPANFRSPSNPWYFDSGRTDPLALTHGLDLARVTVGSGQYRTTVGYVAATREVPTAGPNRQSAFLKFDQQGSDHLASVVLMKPTEKGEAKDDAFFIGAFAQYSPDDAWVIYGEFGNGRQPYRLRPTSDSAITLDSPGKRGSAGLIGASYSQESGKLIFLEYLHDQGGFSRSERRAWFDSAERAGGALPTAPITAARTLGQLLQFSPRLLGRNYLWLAWQSNPQIAESIWRAELTVNADDGSGAAMLYGEKSLGAKVSAFAVINKNFGSRRTEFGSLTDMHVLAGLKLFAF
ncbi:MAG: hypothetical protein LBF50_05500 [Azoarcus sp.]|jgi:hypothetical protein|nr:hypothetical protein [Azoarcus sp.]